MQYPPEEPRSWNLFLDSHKESHITDRSKYYHICRNVRNVKSLVIRFGPPTFISFSTELGRNEYGERESALDLIAYLRDRYKCPAMAYQVHEKQRQ